MFVHLEARIRLPLCEMWLLQSQLTITSLIKSNWKNRKHPSYSQLEEHLQSTEHRSPILLQYANLQAQPQLCLDLLLVLIKSYFDYTFGFEWKYISLHDVCFIMSLFMIPWPHLSLREKCCIMSHQATSVYMKSEQLHVSTTQQDYWSPVLLGVCLDSTVDTPIH